MEKVETRVQKPKQYRTVLRGSCTSYHMPGEDILESLQRNCTDRNLSDLPHPEECLKYMLRVVVKVNGLDLKKHLKQIMVRPFVLVALLDFLIDRNHEVFRGKGSPQELRAKMRAAVAREYPETEACKPEAEHMIEAIIKQFQCGELEVGKFRYCCKRTTSG